MPEEKLTYDRRFGLRRTMIFDKDKPDKFTVHTEVDMTNVVDNNAELREIHPSRSTNKLIARGVPLTVWEQSVREEWDERDWAKWLNDPDNKAFRVWLGRV